MWKDDTIPIYHGNAYLVRVAFFVGIRFVWGLGFWKVHVTGALASCAQAPVIVSNHIGVVEAAYLLARTGASAVTTVENSRLPLLCR
jgi:hypothetical protein